MRWIAWQMLVGDRAQADLALLEAGCRQYDRDTPAVAVPRGNLQQRYPLHFVRVEPFVVPKKSLTGETTERVDTRVLQVIYELDPAGLPPLFVGQQVEVYVDSAVPGKAEPAAAGS